MSFLNVNKIENPFLRTVARAKFDPNWFCEYILNSPNDPWQSEMMDAIADVYRLEAGLPTKHNHEGKTRFSICSMHGTGKTHFIAKCMHWFGFINYEPRIPCTGPKEKSITTRTFPEFRKILNGANPFYKKLIDIKATKIVWLKNPNWFAVVESANKVENLQGYHEKNLLFLVEEASGVDDEMFPAIEGALTTEGAILVMIGNPTRDYGEFYDSHNKSSTSEHYYTKKIKHSETPRITKKWVDLMKRKYGVKSPIFQIRVLGNWVKGSAKQVIHLNWLESALLEDQKTDGTHPRLVISADVGDGSDLSIITIMYMYETRVHFVKQKHYSFEPSRSPILVAKEMIRLFKEFKGNKSRDKMVADAIGVGAGTVGHLLENGYSNCTIGFKGGEQAKKKTKFRNRRSECYNSLSVALMNDQVSFADDFIEDNDDWLDFCNQLTTLQYAVKTERVQDVETKEKHKERLGKSPDRGDSAMMGFAVKSFDFKLNIKDKLSSVVMTDMECA